MRGILVPLAVLTSMVVFANLLVFTQPGVSHAAVTSFEVRSYVEHSVDILDCCTHLAIKGDTSPNASIETSFESDEIGNAYVHASSEVVGASASGVSIMAHVSGSAVAGPAIAFAGRLWASAVEGSGSGIHYEFTIDAPTAVDLHAQVQRDFTSPFTSFGVNMELRGLNTGPISGLAFNANSNSQPDLSEVTLDSGPILLQPDTYYLSMGISGDVVVTSPNDAGSFSISSSLTLSILESNNPSKSAVIISNGSTAPFAKSLVVTANVIVGKMVEVVGTATVYRADGSSEPIGVNTLIRKGDTIETAQDGAVNILFRDGTTFAINESAQIKVDDFDPDQNGRDKSTFFSLLQGAFIWTSGLIGKEDGTVYDDTPVGALGIRGDATPYINKDFLDVAAKMETVASPVSLVAPVPAAHEAGEMSFDYVFLTPTGTLDVFLDEAPFFSVSASEHPVNVFQRATIALDARSALPSDTAKLTFHFDGPVGSKLLIDNVVFPGIQDGDFNQLDNGWFWVGPSRLDPVATISDTRLAFLSSPGLDTLILTNPAVMSKSATASFSFVSNETGSTITCALDSGAFAACTSPKTYTKLRAGSHTFQARATDGVGHTDPTPASYTWTIDTTAPKTSIVTGPKGTIIGTSSTFTWTGTDKVTPTASLDYAYRLDPIEASFSGFGSATTASYNSLPTGSYTFYVKARDQAGNEDATPAKRKFTVQ